MCRRATSACPRRWGASRAPSTAHATSSSACDYRSKEHPMDKELKPFSRRRFIGAGAALPAAMAAATSERPALLGGKPVRTEPFPGWPVRNEVEEKAVLDVVRSGKWGRGVGNAVSRFESAYAPLMSAQHCLATSSGTTA